MALDFRPALGQGLHGTFIYSSPFTVSMWFKPFDYVNPQMLYFQQNALPDNYWKLELNSLDSGAGFGTLRLDAVSTDEGTGWPPTTRGVRFFRWNHVLAVFDSSLKISLNGERLQTGDCIAPVGTDRTNLGYMTDNSDPIENPDAAVKLFTGLIGEVMIWLGDITTDPRVVTALSKGDRRMRKFGTTPGVDRYWSLRKLDLYDEIQGTALAAPMTMAAVADHPPFLNDPMKMGRRRCGRVAGGRFVSLGGYYKPDERTVLVG